MLSKLIVRLLPKRNPLMENTDETELKEDIDTGIDDGIIDFYESTDMEPDFIPFFETIDHLSENTFLDDPRCPETWIYNNKKVEGCETDLRTDKRPWCSLDKIFTG